MIFWDFILKQFLNFPSLEISGDTGIIRGEIEKEVFQGAALFNYRQIINYVHNDVGLN